MGFGGAETASAGSSLSYMDVGGGGITSGTSSLSYLDGAGSEGLLSSPLPASDEGGSSSLLGPLKSLFGGVTKTAGAYTAAQNQYESAAAEASLMRSEADIQDYNADLARWEGVIAERERDIEIDQHRDSVRRILGKNATFYAWGNIDLGDPRGTPAQVRLRNLYNAEYDEDIIIERGYLKKQQAEAKAVLYEFKASTIRSSAFMVEEGGRSSRSSALLSLSGELLKDTGVLS